MRLDDQVFVPPPGLVSEAFTVVAATRTPLADVGKATIAAAIGVAFPELWRAACASPGKQRDLGGCAMIEVQVDELVPEGVPGGDGKRIACS